jgi:hypothetical protein
LLIEVRPAKCSQFVVTTHADTVEKAYDALENQNTFDKQKSILIIPQGKIRKDHLKGNGPFELKNSGAIQLAFHLGSNNKPASASSRL